MAKVHPTNVSSASPSCSSQEKYTVWMKSLVLNGNGCTVYDSNGHLAYRIDNYHNKCSRQVYLMDLKGEVLCTLSRKKLKLNEQWKGYKYDKVKNQRPWFQVKKASKIFKQGAGLSCLVTMGDDESEAFSVYKIQGLVQKSDFQIIRRGVMVAQVKRKQASKGVMLGDDVLSLEVEPHIDHSLIMALVAVYGLMAHKI